VSVYEVSRLLYGLREPVNREACWADPEAYYRHYDLSESELHLLLTRDWQGLVDAGVSIYLLTKLGATPRGRSPGDRRLHARNAA